MQSLHTEIIIEAPPERIWAVLSDFESYPEWNPTIRSIEGVLSEGERLIVVIKQPGRKPMTFRPLVLDAVPGFLFRWRGRLFIPWLFDGEHEFRLEILDDERTRFIHREKFTGILVPFMRRMIENDTREGFEKMNHALKERCERNIPASPTPDPA